MNKWALILLGTGAAAYFAFKTYKDKFVNNAQAFIKENFSIQVSGAKVHKIDKSGLEFRIGADLINLSPITVTVDQLKAYVFLIKNGSPSHLATTTIADNFSIQPRNTSHISDIKLSASYLNLIQNLSALSVNPRQFKIVVQASVNGQNVEFSNTLTA